MLQRLGADVPADEFVRLYKAQPLRLNAGGGMNIPVAYLTGPEVCQLQAKVQLPPFGKA